MRGREQHDAGFQSALLTPCDDGRNKVGERCARELRCRLQEDKLGACLTIACPHFAPGSFGEHYSSFSLIVTLKT
jgi:hypothetical protein